MRGNLFRTCTIVWLIAETTAATSRLSTSPISETALLQIVTPVSKPYHLGLDGHFDFDATLVVNFFQLL
jgi:hypothetical protein